MREPGRMACVDHLTTGQIQGLRRRLMIAANHFEENSKPREIFLEAAECAQGWIDARIRMQVQDMRRKDNQASMARRRALGVGPRR